MSFADRVGSCAALIGGLYNRPPPWVLARGLLRRWAARTYALFAASGIIGPQRRAVRDAGVFGLHRTGAGAYVYLGDGENG